MSDYMEPGTWLLVYVQRTGHPARVLAKINEELLIEYDTSESLHLRKEGDSSGYTSLVFAHTRKVRWKMWMGRETPWLGPDDWRCNHSGYERLPLKWLKAIVSAGQSWKGQKRGGGETLPVGQVLQDCMLHGWHRPV